MQIFLNNIEKLQYRVVIVEGERMMNDGKVF